MAPNNRIAGSALGTGFNKAWSAIIDSNVTTLLAAGLLFVLASGPVKGFGVTLSIGVLASMISALIIARVLTEQAARLGWLQRHPKASGLATTGRVRDALRRRNPDIMSRSKLWLGISASALLLAVLGIFVNGAQGTIIGTDGDGLAATTFTVATVPGAGELSVIVAFERYRIHSATGSWPTPEHRRIASSRFSCWLLLSY